MRITIEIDEPLEPHDWSSIVDFLDGKMPRNEKMKKKSYAVFAGGDRYEILDMETVDGITWYKIFARGRVRWVEAMNFSKIFEY